MKYRAEIDGLRTVAVVPVVLFHAGWEVFSGGYVGVDVFFVISGFLITSIIIGERAEGRFSILRFYERRARRILPALFVVLAATLPFAWAWMPPDAFQDFLRSLAFAALFISNVHFWEYSGYFAQASEMRPLLHTWSLAVEEQYYVFFPLLMAALGAFSRRKHIAVIGVLAFLSLALSEWGWRNYPEENFFFTFSRMWELFAGSLCAFIAFRRELRGNQILSLIGMGLILWSVFAYDASVPFPSVYTLVPVVGTALVLLFAQRGTAVAWVLSRKLPVAIGLISYSAYLWHQPLLAFARIRSLHEPSLWLMSGLALASFALAALTWRYVEQPFRSGPHRMLLPARPALFGASLAGIAAFAAIGIAGKSADWSNAAFSSPMMRTYGQSLRINHGLNDACADSFKAPEACRTGDAPELLIWGDSYAMHLVPGFLASDRAPVLKQSTIYSCSPVLGVTATTDRATEHALHCLSFNARTLEWLAGQDSVTHVVLSSPFHLVGTNLLSSEGEIIPAGDNTDLLIRAMQQTITAIRALGKKVIVFAPTPNLGTDLGTCAVKAIAYLDDEAYCDFDQASARNATLETFFDWLPQVVPVVTLEDMICDGTRCDVVQDGVVLYRDAGHLSIPGSRWLGARHDFWGLTRNRAE